MIIRAAGDGDREAIWRILEPVIRAGETYTFPTGWTREQAIKFWFSAEHEVFVFEENGQIAGTYFLRPNQHGGGSHVANCGYITAQNWAGRGVARAMCRHSMEHARERGFLAMQYNFVIASNERAVAVWLSMGFEIVGKLPGAFQHPTSGFVDAYVMYRKLVD